MQKCFLTITSVADGKESSFARTGKFESSLNSTCICYQEENADVSLRLENGVVSIDRKGDYTLCLRLKKGEKTQGWLGINGTQGEIETETSRIAYSVTENSFMLSLRYTLLIGGERQDMKFCLYAKTENKGEGKCK